jgi:hypothetical protein
MNSTEKRGYYKRVNGKTYGPYWYERPVHHWKPKDLARIAKKLAKNDENMALTIMVTIAMSLGFGYMFCKIAKALTAALSVTQFVKQIGAVLALSTLVTVVLEFLLAVKLVAPSWLKIILALLIALFVFIDKLFNVLNDFAETMDTVNDASKFVGKLCDKANELAGIAIDKTCEAISEDACYWAVRDANILIDKVKPDIDRMIDFTNETLLDEFIQIIKDIYHS